MSTDLRDQVLRLPVDERMQLLEDLWDSIASSPDAVELTPAQRVELERRLAFAEQNPSAGVSWEDLEAELSDE